MSASTLGWLMVACGAATFLIRYSFIAAEGHYAPPAWFRRALAFVPVVALTALTVPELLVVDGSLRLANPRLLAGLVAIIVAARWRSVLLTIGVGYATLMTLKFRQNI